MLVVLNDLAVYGALPADESIQALEATKYRAASREYWPMSEPLSQPHASDGECA